MIRIDETHIECEDKLYKIVPARNGCTCSVCSCDPCRDHEKRFAASCFKLIGNNSYLRRCRKK